MYLIVSLPDHLTTCLPACLPACLPSHLSVCLSVCLLVCLTVCLAACPPNAYLVSAFPTDYLPAGVFIPASRLNTSLIFKGKAYTYHWSKAVHVASLRWVPTLPIWQGWDWQRVTNTLAYRKSDLITTVNYFVAKNLSIKPFLELSIRPKVF